MTIDVGAGDGRAVLATAAADPSVLVIGLDANAAAMAEASRRAARAPRRGGLPNARFLLAPAEAPPVVLRAVADLVTVLFPWGSLLRGCLGHDDAVARGVAGLVAPGGALELTLAPAERDGLAALPTELRAVTAAARGAFEPHGLGLVEARPATSDEVMASSWGRRLLRGAHEDERAGDRRPVTIRLERRIRCNP